MNRRISVFCSLLAAVGPWCAAAQAEPENPAAPPPFKNGERLRYEVVWPSGLSLGEAEFVASSSQAGWEFHATIGADLPTVKIRDEYRSQTDPGLCAQEFDKDARHGDDSWRESIVLDQAESTAHRSTKGGGGESDFAIPPCARDALSYLYFMRRNLAEGRIPPPDDIVFGALYQISVTYAETRQVDVFGAKREADRILVDIGGPGSQHSFEIFFGKDEARTPLIIKVPFDLGTFSLKLVE